jgi:hypothetical protein
MSAQATDSLAIKRECRSCRHFRNDAQYIETVFRGLTSLSSGAGSARADDGVCLRHDRYLSARASCADFAASDVSIGSTHRA